MHKINKYGLKKDVLNTYSVSDSTLDAFCALIRMTLISRLFFFFFFCHFMEENRKPQRIYASYSVGERIVSGFSNLVFLELSTPSVISGFTLTAGAVQYLSLPFHLRWLYHYHYQKETECLGSSVTETNLVLEILNANLNYCSLNNAFSFLAKDPYFLESLSLWMYET